MYQALRARLPLLLLLLLVGVGQVTPAAAQGRDRSLFPNDPNVLALWEFDGTIADLSGNGRDGDLLGGEFVTTPFGRGLQVGGGGAVAMGLDWSEYAALLRHPYTIEMVLFPEDTTSWRKLFSFDDGSDQGWYYRAEGIQSYPNPTLGAGGVPAQEWAYLAFVSTSPEEVEVFFNGQRLGVTPAGFIAPPAEAIFFRDDRATGRGEQLDGIIEALRISDVARDPQEITLFQDQLLRGDSGARPIVDTIPTPQQVEFTPEVVGTNVALALFLALAFGLVCTVFNSTIKENEAVMQAAIRQRTEPLLRPFRGRLSGRSIPATWTRNWLFILLLLILSALIYAFLDPTFVLDRTGAPLLISLFLSLLVVTVAYDMVQGRLGQRFFGRTGTLEAFPSALLIAVGCVLVSRLLGFQPGYLLGFVAAFVLTSDPMLDEPGEQRQSALLILAGGAVLLVTALVAWLLTGLLAGSPVVHATLALVFVAGLEGVLFVLLPLRFVDGWIVFEWSKVVWFAAFAVATYWFCQILLNPGSSYLDAFAESNVRLVLLMLALYTLLTAGVWYYFRRRAVAAATP